MGVAASDTQEWKPVVELSPDREEFTHLKYPPFVLDLHRVRVGWGDLRIDGFRKGQQVISKTLSGFRRGPQVQPRSG